MADTRLPDPLDQARHCADAALGMMARQDIPPQPENFSVWYAYVSGRNPELTEAINEILRRGAGFSPEINDALFERFAAQTPERGALRELSQRADETFRRLGETTAAAVTGSAGHAAAIEAAAARLDPPPPPALLAELTEILRSESRAAAAASRRLEQDLATSARELARLREALGALEADAATDALTQLANRRSFDAALAQAVGQAEYGGRPLCLAMIDLDHFKRFNDHHGHPLGDQVLKLIGRMLLDGLRPRDSAARYGGEEFALILPDTDLADATAQVEALRQRVATRTLTNRRTGESLGQITLSAGLAAHVGGEGMDSLLRRADQALYRAKQAGRNRIAHAED